MLIFQDSRGDYVFKGLSNIELFLTGKSIQLVSGTIHEVVIELHIEWNVVSDITMQLRTLQSRGSCATERRANTSL